MSILTPSEVTTATYTITPQESFTKFDNTYWEAGPGSWDGTKWVSQDIRGFHAMTLYVLGTWYADYRPDFIRVTGTAGLTGSLIDSDEDYTISSWTMSERSPCVFAGLNIEYMSRLSVGGGAFEVTNIEFIFNI